MSASRDDWPERYAAGESTYDLAAEACITPATAREWLLRRGVTLRDREAAAQMAIRRGKRPGRVRRIDWPEAFADQFSRRWPNDERREWARRMALQWAKRLVGQED